MKYTGDYTREIAFPLGGIGTGSVSLNGSGRLVDWEIFNRPAKGSVNGNSFIAIRALKGGKPMACVLNGDMQKDYVGQYKHKQAWMTGYGYGPETATMAGFPHFRNVEFDGEFPIARLKFTDDRFPASVNMTAFNPFIPCDSENSSIPAAFFEIEVENITDESVDYQVAFTLSNPYEASRNNAEIKDGFNALMLYNSGAEKDAVEYGDLSVATDCEDSFVQNYWYRGSWKDSISTFWNEFAGTEGLKSREYTTDGKYDRGTIAANITVLPHEKKKVRFVLSWNVPNNYNYWSEYKDENGKHRSWKNYYAVKFDNSLTSAEYSLKNWDSLYSRTELFKNTLYGSTLPDSVKEAAAANLSVLKSPTVLRLQDGSFYGWEGVMETVGSCEGTCQHVWNYAYALCFLFPDLERSIRNLEFEYSTNQHGKMNFRLALPLGRPYDNRACVDGQMGAVIKFYRDWKLCGDNEWLKRNWDNIKKVLEYAWSPENPDGWDLDKDGVLEGRQHHTLDMELFGPSSWLEGMYLAALKAAAEMAEFLGDTAKAEEYRELFEKGYNWTKENLFNGSYFIQKVDITDKSITDKFSASQYYWNDEAKQIKYQILDGSSIDQLLAQWHADIIGLGDIFDSEQISSALREMMKNNFKPCMRDFVNMWRLYSLNDEAGTVICDYPEGAKRPIIPIPYCDETMTGFEYSFAGLLCTRNMVSDGLCVVSSVRDRFDGKKRNPWNEFECGSNYARSMASYALIPILSGFEFDMPKKYIGFKPYKEGDFSCIWSLDGAWGSVKLSDNKFILSVSEGELSLSSLGIKFSNNVSCLTIDGKATDFEFKDNILYFDETAVKNEITVEIIL